MRKQLFSAYSLKYTKTVIYMLQRCEYEIKPFLKWYFKVEDFNKISIRGSLVRTSKSKLLLLLLQFLILVDIAGSVYLLTRVFASSNPLYWFIGVILLILAPFIGAMLLLVPLVLARVFIVLPQQKILINKSTVIFKNTKATKIAVAGSFGKTTMKELLATVLSEGGLVAATPANKNVTASHAIFASRLSGDEKFIIVEFGEGKPGDVAEFTKTVNPNIGVITGIAPAHLDKYPSVEAAANDIFSLFDQLEHKNTYVNGESNYIKNHLMTSDQIYSRSGVGDWKVSNVSNGFDGISFDLISAKQKIKVRSKLLGRHQIGPLSAVAVIALNNGLSIKQVEAGLAKTTAFEHRMELKTMSGAYVIDDAYNGNLEGIKAGLNLIKELKAKRKIYVTPGLVDQGKDTAKIHNQIGELILEANPQKVVLIKNSVTEDILAGMTGYSGEVIIETNPLQFYLNLDKFLATSDLLLMQNDWPDNYK
jgi:UDP-N-acetylmuramoyl-tripeptide--D-alanyl-D-alanine ligase